MLWAARAKRIDLIEKDDTWSRVTSPLEDLTNSPLALTNILQHKHHHQPSPSWASHTQTDTHTDNTFESRQTVQAFKCTQEWRCWRRVQTLLAWPHIGLVINVEKLTIFNSSGPLTEMKFKPDSLATACKETQILSDVPWKQMARQKSS